MDNKILIDTDILIDFLRGNSETGLLLEKIQDRTLLTTDINAFELYHGAYKQKDKEKGILDVERMLNQLQLLSTNRKSMRKAGEIVTYLDKKGEKVDTADILIGSICIINSASILTRNRKHFEKMNVRIFEEEIK